jgi:dihydroflavonol-4-reductase
MILVTGATGFIGAHLLYYLTENQKPIRALKRKNSSLEQVKNIFRYLDELGEGKVGKQKFEDIEWVDADILDLPELENKFEGVTEGYHAAVILSFVPGHRKEVLHCNINGTANIMNLSLEKGVEKVLHISSIAALDRKENEEVNESDFMEEMKFSSAYSESKFYSEMEVWRAMAEGLNAVIVNPGIVLGVGDFSKGSPKMLTAVEKVPFFYPAGINSFVDARDVAKCSISLMNSSVSGERFIVSEGNYSYKKIFDAMADGLKKKKPSIKISRIMSELLWRGDKIRSLFTGRNPTYTKHLANTVQNNFYYSSKKIREFNDHQFIPIEKTIVDMCRIYRQNGALSQ